MHRSRFLSPNVVQTTYYILIMSYFIISITFQLFQYPRGSLIRTRCVKQCKDVLEIPTRRFIQVSQVLSAWDIIPTCRFIQMPQVLSVCDIIPTCRFIQVSLVLSVLDIIPTCRLIQVSLVLSVLDKIPTCHFIQVPQVLSACYAEFLSILLSIPHQEFLPGWDVSDGAVIEATTVLEGQQVLLVPHGTGVLSGMSLMVR